ncbi:hypothetical protein H6G89_23220 [Oscillatoria sp. FACHB-1407]|uniref:DNA sulfur modification protein DndB n=1 Tax=Oscillatoria sp. FACHB-1407 TaxID=2692847 RepID=UPI001685DCDF|nr:DNA sulfur modification protein DndB [Oscillatoria sp. FACHB-1407]MBD2463917.1 hypothetical protein [Oscillatoria sp. FACHB-1407]
MYNAFEYVLQVTKINGDSQDDSSDCYTVVIPLNILQKLLLTNYRPKITREKMTRDLFEKVLSIDVNKVLMERVLNHIDSIVVSLSSSATFEPFTAETSDEQQGQLRISMETDFIVIKGLRALNAIKSHISEIPECWNVAIELKILVPKSGSNNINHSCFDNEESDELSDLINELLSNYSKKKLLIAKVVIEAVEPFKLLTDIENSSLPSRSSKLFTLSSIRLATSALLANMSNISTLQQAELAISYWHTISKYMPEWWRVIKREVSAGEIRRDYVHSHAPVLLGLGYFGAALLQEDPINWEKRLEAIAHINWSRSNPEWDGRIITEGRISKAKSSSLLVASYLKSLLGLSLTPEEGDLEEKLNVMRSLHVNKN